MECKKCGHTIPEQAKFCPECGAPVLQEEPVEEVVEEILSESEENKEEIVEEVAEEPVDETVTETKDPVVEEVEESIEKEATKSENKEWYYVKGSQSVGPHTLNEMISLIENKEIQEDTLVWKAGMADWKPLKDTELKEYLSAPDVKPNGDQWYFVDANNKQNGPYTLEQMKGLIQAHQIYGNTFVWKTGMADWKRLKETELADMVMPEAPKTQSMTSHEKIFITQRSIGMSILLAIVTCGIYYYYWLYCIARDANACLRAQDKQPLAEPGLVVLLNIITCGIYGYYYYWKFGKAMSELEFDNGFRIPDNSVILLVLPILQLGIISMAICQSTLNDIDRYANE